MTLFLALLWEINMAVIFSTNWLYRQPWEIAPNKAKWEKNVNSTKLSHNKGVYSLRRNILLEKIFEQIFKIRGVYTQNQKWISPDCLFP